MLVGGTSSAQGLLGIGWVVVGNCMCITCLVCSCVVAQTEMSAELAGGITRVSAD